MKKSNSYALVKKTTGEIIATGNRKEMHRLRKASEGNTVYHNDNHKVGDFLK